MNGKNGNTKSTENNDVFKFAETNLRTESAAVSGHSKAAKTQDNTKTSNAGDIFRNKTIEEADYCENPKWIDLAELYKHACKELTLQQSKRDQVIYGFVLLFSIITPVLLSVDYKMSTGQKGLILLAICAIGAILSVIIVRYRIYKEAYWITCLTITQLRNLKEEAVTKRNIQAMYYHCLKKKWEKYVLIKRNGKKRFRYWSIFWSNLFSAESLHYVIIAFLTSIAFGFGLYLIDWTDFVGWSFPEQHSLRFAMICAGAGFAIFALQLWFYYYNLWRVYAVLVDDKNSSFNFTFSKAWFLHFYRD